MQCCAARRNCTSREVVMINPQRSRSNLPSSWNKPKAGPDSKSSVCLDQFCFDFPRSSDRRCFQTILVRTLTLSSLIWCKTTGFGTSSTTQRAKSWPEEPTTFDSVETKWNKHSPRRKAPRRAKTFPMANTVSLNCS